MGATVTCDKLAAAFTAPGGKTFYVLFEETFEKNVHPHRPHWSCIHLGTLESAMKRIFACAGVCEGGMLQGRGGWIRPEGYIEGWLRQLAEPVAMRDQDIRLEVRDVFSAAVPKEHADKVVAILHEARYTDAADALADGRAAILNLHRDAELLASIYGGEVLAPWRVLGTYWAPTHAARVPSLGYAPKAARNVALDPVEVLKVADQDNRLLRRADGSWYCAGWAYSLVAKYVEDYWRTELVEPGGFRKRIRAYRSAVEDAPMVPPGTKVSVDPSKAPDRWMQERIDGIRAKLPVVATAEGFEVVPDEESLWDVCGLGRDCATWLLPSPAITPSVGSTARQMDLL
jgi:hypothetical protein